MWRLRSTASWRCAASSPLLAGKGAHAQPGRWRLPTLSCSASLQGRSPAHLSPLLTPLSTSRLRLFSTSSSPTPPSSDVAASLSSSSPLPATPSSTPAPRPSRARRGRGSRSVAASPPSTPPSPPSTPPPPPPAPTVSTSAAPAVRTERPLSPPSSTTKSTPSVTAPLSMLSSLPPSPPTPPRTARPTPNSASSQPPPHANQSAAAAFVPARFSPAISFASSQPQQHYPATAASFSPSSTPAHSSPTLTPALPTELSAIDDAELSPAPALPSSPFPRSPSSSSAYSTLPPHESTYVSTHYHVDVSDVHAYLRRKGLSFRASANGAQLLIRDCPFCHPIAGKVDNQYKLTIYFPNADHFCHRCRARGSWFDLKKRLGDLCDRVVTLRDQVLQPHYTKGFPAFTKSDGGLAESDSAASAARRHRQPSQQSLLHFHAQLPQFPEVVRWLTEGAEQEGRGLRRDLLDFYHVGAGRFRFVNEQGKWVEEECVTFPWMRIKEEKIKKAKPVKPEDAGSDTVESSVEDAAQSSATQEPFSSSSIAVSSSTSSPPSPAAPSYIVERVKYRSRVSKANQRLLPAGGNWGFFGYHTIPASATRVILTEGEFDAIAAYQCTGVPAISLPNGANSLPVELLPFLERFSTIYVWMDDDRVGQEGAETFAKKLGIQRCLIVRTRAGEAEGPKDANDALLQGYDLGQILAAAAPLPHEQITTFTQLRDDVWKEIADPQQRAGVQSTSLPSLNRLLKGHRRGELTIITGATGVGKTTVLSQMSLDFCAQGVVTLWGSFEIKNFKLAKTMLGQLSGVELSHSQHQFDHYADQFERLPMYFMRFFGSSSVEQVLDAMDYAVYMHDVQHVVLDNLQFMLTGQGGVQSMDRFELQDRAISEFRHFATHRNVHISLVIHPRKEAEQRPLSVSSVFGSAKATQEADNVIILQAPIPPSVVASAAFASDSSGWLRQKVNLPADDSASDESSSRFRRLQVSKNRYDGEVGAIPFLYDRPTGRIQEVDKDGNVKHRAVFPSVVPAPMEGTQLEGGKKRRRQRKKEEGGEGGVGAAAAAEFEEEVEENEEALPPAPALFRPAPLFTPPPLASVLPHAAAHMQPPHAPATALVSEGAGADEHALQAGEGEEDDGDVLLSHSTAGKQQQQQQQRRWSRASGDPHRSNPPFEFLA